MALYIPVNLLVNSKINRFLRRLYRCIIQRAYNNLNRVLVLPFLQIIFFSFNSREDINWIDAFKCQMV